MVYEQHSWEGRKTFHVIQLGAKARRWTDRAHTCVSLGGLWEPPRRLAGEGGWVGIRTLWYDWVSVPGGCKPCCPWGRLAPPRPASTHRWAQHQEAECISVASGAHWHYCPIPVPSPFEPGQHSTQGLRVQSLVLPSRRRQAWEGSVLSEPSSGLQVPQGSWKVQPRGHKGGGGQEKEDTHSRSSGLCPWWNDPLSYSWTARSLLWAPHPHFLDILCFHRKDLWWPSGPYASDPHPHPSSLSRVHSLRNPGRSTFSCTPASLLTFPEPSWWRRGWLPFSPITAPSATVAIFPTSPRGWSGLHPGGMKHTTPCTPFLHLIFRLSMPHCLHLPPGMATLTPNCQLALSRSLRAHYRHIVQRASIYRSINVQFLGCEGQVHSCHLLTRKGGLRVSPQPESGLGLSPKSCRPLPWLEGQGLPMLSIFCWSSLPPWPPGPRAAWSCWEVPISWPTCLYHCSFWALQFL